MRLLPCTSTPTKTIIKGLATIKIKIRQCYTDNPLQFWDKNKEETRLEMIDKSTLSYMFMLIIF